MSSVQSVERAFAVLRCLADGPAGVSEIAERIDLPKSTVSRLLSTLQSLGAVDQVSAGGDYRVGTLIAEIGAGAGPGRTLVDVARPFVRELAAITGEAAGLSILDGATVVYLDNVESNHAVQVRDWTGERLPLHVVSSGLVLLAHAPARTIESYLSTPLERFTPRTMVQPARLRRRLASLRRRGYEWVHDEFADGLSSVAAPVRDSDGNVVAALHAHGPSYRFPPSGRAAAVGEKVADVATRLSGRLAEPGAVVAPSNSARPREVG